MVILYKLKISHHNRSYLNSFTLKFIELLKKCGITVKVISLPKKEKKLTVLRSPHVSKKSREQFTHITYSQLLVFSQKPFFKATLKKLLALSNCDFKLNYTSIR